MPRQKVKVVLLACHQGCLGEEKKGSAFAKHKYVWLFRFGLKQNGKVQRK
jgi:hypothetical protein